MPGEGAGWIKAPDFADHPRRREQVRAQTVADRYRYLDDGLTPVGCAACGARVLVRTAGVHQRSVQWTVNPADHCPFFRELAAGPGRPDGCPNLERAIDHAAAEGLLTIDDR